MPTAGNTQAWLSMIASYMTMTCIPLGGKGGRGGPDSLARHAPAAVLVNEVEAEAETLFPRGKRLCMQSSVYFRRSPTCCSCSQ